MTDGRVKKNGFFHRKSQEKKAKKIRNPHKKIPKMLKKHAGISSGFVQKIFCFVQIPESFVQKHETAAGKNEGNTKEIFLGTA